MNKPQTQITLLNIGGMSCAGCVKSVETALSTVPGVDEVSVNFADQTAAVSGNASIDLLLPAVEHAGYRASLLEEASLAGQEEEVRQHFRKSAFRSLLALLCGGFLMADMWMGLLPSLQNQLVWTLVGLVTLSMMLITGSQFYRGAFNALMHRTATMDTLVALGTGTAWLFSMIVILVPSLIPVESQHQYFEAALFIIGFINLGKALEDSARSRTSIAIRKLFDLAPRFARRVSGADESMVPLEQVVKSDLLLVLPGESFPVDGLVLEGEGAVDESMLTGESVPVQKVHGDVVRAGTLNTDGRLKIEVQSVGADTVLSQIARLVREAQNSKPKIGRLVDRITSIFVPFVIAIAVLTGMGWYMFGPEPQLSFALVTTMSVLIVACPCALGLAIPMSIMVGLGRAAATGVLVKNSEVLQVASGLTTVVFDKTGTLTEGRPAVTNVVNLGPEDLSAAASIAGSSEHPLSKGISRYCSEQQIELAEPHEFKSFTGGGISGLLGDDLYLLGSQSFLRSQGVAAVNVANPSGSVVCIARNGEFLGYFELKDEARKGISSLLDKLRQRGIRLVMLTGDQKQIAEEIGRELGIHQVYAGLMPEDKLERIRAMQARGEVVGMVGDGINDAAALSVADVGFAMGKGAEIAMESADVTLLKDSVQGVDDAIGLSKEILKNIYQNLTAAFAYNLLLIPVAAGAIYPMTGRLIDPALAGLAMALSSISVVLNAGRLRFK